MRMGLHAGLEEEERAVIYVSIVVDCYATTIAAVLECFSASEALFGSDI